MVKCEKCHDPFESYEWFVDRYENWKLGIKIDENLFREHICKQIEIGPRKYWCIQCNAPIPFKNPCIHRRQKINPEQKIGWFS